MVVITVCRSRAFRYAGAQRAALHLIRTAFPGVPTPARLDQYSERFGLTDHPSSGIIGHRYQVTNSVPWTDILKGDGGPSRTRTCGQRIMSPLL